MKAKDKTTGTFKEVYVKALDSLPVGAVVEYEGTSADIPVGWQAYSTGKIKKTSNTRAIANKTVNVKSNSTTDAYTCDYSNKAFGGTILWTNSNPAATSGMTINLSSSDYDLLFVLFTQDAGDTSRYSAFCNKGNDFRLIGASSQGTLIRNLTRSSDTRYVLSDIQGSAANKSTSNIIPIQIIGYKTGLFN